jgi:6-pyruvoyltetrahydropterin/6-carboxytetrahydropterin synthase
VSRTAVVEIHKDELSFSAGHFTIFSATSREDMHGHNYYVSAKFHVTLNDNGLAFDYRIYKRKLLALCDQLDRRFLLPSKSKFLKLEDTGDMWIAHYGAEKIPFLKRDVTILPICNVTIEELSNWFLEHITQDSEELKKYQIQSVTVKVFNGPGQSGSTTCGQQPG